MQENHANEERSSRLETVIELSPLIAFARRLEPGWPVEFVSDSVQQLGYPPEKLLSGELRYEDLIHPDDRERVVTEVASFLATDTKSFHQRYRLVTSEGKDVWIDDRTTLAENTGRAPLVTRQIVSDIAEDEAKNERIRHFIEVTGGIYLYLDAQGRVTDCNNATCKVTGLSREELLGVHWIDRFVPDDVKSKVNLVNSKVWSGSFSDPGAFSNEIEVNGKRHLIRWSFTVDPGPSGEPIGLICFGQDITQIRGLSERISDIAAVLPGGLIQFTLKPDGQYTIEVLNDYCEILWETPAKELEANPSIIWDLVIPEDQPALERSVLSSVETGENWFHEWRTRTPGGKLKWLQGTGRPRRRPDGSSYWASTIIDVSTMKNAITAKVEALRKSVHALAAVVEARDPYTAGHESNVADICVKIGNELGLPSDVLDGLELAASIHDIGKISVPAEILSKPGKLTSIEYELVKCHPRTGANFVRDIDFERPIAAIIEQHHERLDGSGYPDGLRGDDILLEARIIAVADTFDAIASHRPYRPALGARKALEIIEDGRGTAFDPQLVDVLAALVASGSVDINQS